MKLRNKVVNLTFISVAGMIMQGCNAHNRPTFQQKPTFTEYLGSAHNSGHGLFVTIADEKGMRAYGDAQTGMTSIAKTDSQDMSKSPYFTNQSKRIENEGRKIESDKRFKSFANEVNSSLQSMDAKIMSLFK